MKNEIGSGWQQALDGRLLRRLARPVGQPGVIRRSFVRGVLERPQAMIKRLPLLEQVRARHSVLVREAATPALPLVVARRMGTNLDEGSAPAPVPAEGPGRQLPGVMATRVEEAAVEAARPIVSPIAVRRVQAPAPHTGQNGPDTAAPPASRVPSTTSVSGTRAGAPDPSLATVRAAARAGSGFGARTGDSSAPAPLTQPAQGRPLPVLRRTLAAGRNLPATRPTVDGSPPQRPAPISPAPSVATPLVVIRRSADLSAPPLVLSAEPAMAAAPAVTVHAPELQRSPDPTGPAPLLPIVRAVTTPAMPVVPLRRTQERQPDAPAVRATVVQRSVETRTDPGTEAAGLVSAASRVQRMPLPPSAWPAPSVPELRRSYAPPASVLAAAPSRAASVPTSDAVTVLRRAPEPVTGTSANRPVGSQPATEASASPGETPTEDELVERVLRKLSRQLAIESERRGWHRWS